MAVTTFAAMAAGYRNLWNRAIISTNKAGAVDAAARRILAARPRYEAVEAQTGVPWQWLGVIHMRESNNDFRGVLHNGEKIIGTGRRTSLVPKGRGPFQSWEQAAVDAIRLKGLEKIGTWPIERQLYEAERFNGWGYTYKGINSPYVWAATNLQQPGKYIRDGVFDPNHMDTQLGVAAVLKRLHQLSVDLSPGRPVPPAPMPPPATLPQGPSKPPIAPEVQGGIGAAILAMLAAAAAWAADNPVGVGVGVLLLVAVLFGGLYWRRRRREPTRAALADESPVPTPWLDMADEGLRRQGDQLQEDVKWIRGGPR